MAKKKKTLRAAVLASIFAMAFSATAWAADGSGYIYNPTLNDESGYGTGITNPNEAAYGYNYNYYLQYYEKGNNFDVAGSTDAEVAYDGTWDRVVGVKLVTTFDSNNSEEKISSTIKIPNYNSDGTLGQGESWLTIHGAQFQHIRYNSTGGLVNPDHTNINSIFLYDTSSTATNYNKTHYCGESAQSISIGQLQRMVEIFYENDVSLMRAFETTGTKINVLEEGWTAKVGNVTSNIGAAETLVFESKDNNLSVVLNAETQTIELDFSDKPTFSEVTIGSTTIQSSTEGNLTYSYKEGDTVINKTIATTDDGMRYGADNSEVELDLDLNDKLNIKGDNTNITTVAIAATEDTPAQIQVKLNNDITVNSVTANTIKAGNVNVTHTLTSNVVDANTVNAGNVNVTHTLTSNVVDANTVNAGNVNVTHTLKSNVVDSNTVVAAVSVTTPKIYLGESGNEVTYKNDRITYVNGQGEQQVANLNDGYYYTGDITTKVNGANPYADLTGKTINVYGGATDLVSSTTKNIGVTTTQTNAGIEMNLQLAKDLGGFESISVPGKDGKDGVDGTTITNEGIVITGPKGDSGKDGKDGTVTIKHDQVDVGGNRIENVADGVNPTDAVNVRQLDKLGNRVDKVGAGAAALAALHPLDFDPDDKLSFSAGVGNYGGETASALGMFYRPTEKVMLSAAGTMGNGENMVNMGVTFALDRKNNVSNSRVAMAREIQDLREQVAALTALVTQLAGRNNPALMDTVMFPDVPENHWAYDYIEGLQKRGIVEGYPDGNFGGDRSMTRYEYAAMLYRALEKGFPVDSRLLDEFDAELGRIRIDRIKGLDDDGNKIERVRVNQYEGRDDYGSKLTTVNEAE